MGVTVDDVVAKINEDFGMMFHQTDDGFQSKVCVLCNRHIMATKLKWIEKTMLQRRRKILMPIANMSLPLRQACTYTGPGSTEHLRECALSPSAFYCTMTQSFASCKDCHADFYTNGKRPFFSLANNFVFGNPPPELTVLNDVELSLVARSRISGHIFTFHGGSHKSMKGMHSIYDVNIAHLEHSLEYLESLEFPRVIACVISGPFTKSQKKYVIKKMSVDREKVRAALNWLRQNNKFYANVTDQEIDSFPDPIVIDRSQECISENNNVEMAESFEFVFPDSSCTENNGGFENKDEMKEILCELKSKGHEFTLSSYSTKNLLREFDSHTFEKAFPLQFPYGRGGRHDQHYNTANNVCVIEFIKYIEYLVDLAVPSFQMPSFLLVACNGFFRSRILQRSCWQVSAKNTDDLFHTNVANLQPARLSRAISNVVNGISNIGSTATQLISSLKTVCRAMPHTNEAAKDARSKIYALSLQFGQPAIFFTVSPDDLHNLRIQIYAKNNDDVMESEDSIHNLTEEELKKRYHNRIEFRVNNPGLCSHDFESIITLVEKHIIGWDSEKGCCSESGGLFGFVDAFVCAVEEQGRKSLHGHYAIYLKGWNKLLNQLFNGSEDEKEYMVKEISDWFDEAVGSTKLFGEQLKHRCNNEEQKRVKIVDDTKLRALRHKEGCKVRKGIFAECEDCVSKYSCETLGSKVLTHKYAYPFDISIEEGHTSKAQMLKMQMMIPIFDINHNTDVVNALENLHASSHRKACFKWNEECRHKYPQLPNTETLVRCYTKFDWYSWNGEKMERDIYEMRVKRAKMDLYTNMYCPAVSKSCLACNSNISLIFNGRVPIYMTNYISKGTQEDDSESYKRLMDNVKRRFTHQLHEVDYNEALSRLMSCIFAHTRAHIISAPLAKYLVRNKSRFRFSHEFTSVPLETLNRIITDRPFSLQIQQNKTKAFFVCKAFDYLYRPKSLESLSVYQFYSHYESVGLKIKTGNHPVLPFLPAHPEASERGIRKHNRKVVLKFASWSWPNSKKFEGSIYRSGNRSYKALDTMETFSKWTLLLFSPFREQKHLLTDNRYLACLKNAIANNSLYPDWERILTNIQDVRNNCAVEPPEDELKTRTEPFEKADKKNGRCSQEEKESVETLSEELEELYDYAMGTDFEDLDEFQKDACDEENIKLHVLRNQGYHQCGWKHVSAFKMPEENRNAAFIKHIRAPLEREDDSQATESQNSVRNITTAKKLLSVACERKRRCVSGENDKRAAFPIANGTVTSMLDWSKAGKFDKEQEEAFLTLSASFVLTYYEDAQSINATADHYGPSFRHQIKEQVNLLKRVNAQKYLVMFLTGAAGSGKSEVIKEVLLYCQEYCDQICVPFTDRTIVVTALTGVAAVLVNGETLHSASHVYKKTITSEMIDRWRDARLIIVDEISFANKDLLEDVSSRLCELRETIYKKFGGINIAFMGDFRQLEPIRNEPIYRDKCQAIWSDTVNCFIELKSNHRAKNDPKYAAILKRFRDGHPTDEDIDIINTRVIDDNTVVPDNIQYACPTNKERCAINNAIFLRHLQETHQKNDLHHVPAHTIVIGADNIFLGSAENGNKKPFRFPKLLFENCSEADCKKSNKSRIDPLLKLFKGCPIMLIENANVKEGEANGSVCAMKEIFLKPNTTMEKRCIDGYWVNYVQASQVAYMHVTPELDPDKVFVLTSSKHSTRVHFPKPSCLSTDSDDRIYVGMSMTQFSINVNHATTGHKLQGKSLDQLFISNWMYARNWPYVLLSRARTLEGVFLRMKLKPVRGKDKKDYSEPPELSKMMDQFRRKKVPIIFELFSSAELRADCRLLQENIIAQRQ